MPTPLSEAEAHAIGVEAYVYFYPLITMDLTRKQSTNIEAGKEIGKGPMNTFVNVPEFPPADMKVVVRPNFDTLYSIAWLDMTKEPVVVSVPDTGGRYYLLPMLDMWTDVFASPGWRTTGTQAGHFLVTPPGWRPDLRERFIDEFKLPKDTQRIEAPTPIVWIIGRTKTDGPADYEAVRKIQAGFKLTPLSEWGKTAQAGRGEDRPEHRHEDAAEGSGRYHAGGEVLRLRGGAAQDHSAAHHRRADHRAAQADRLRARQELRSRQGRRRPCASGLASAPAAAQQLMEWKVPTLARVANHWSMNTDTMGVYGNYYLKRAIVSQLGLGANLPEDAIYPLNLGDEAGQPLDGANKYVLHFEKGTTPPVDAFWSVTLYDPEGFQVANSLNRFAVSSWMPFKYNADGSLDLYFQNESPGKDKEQNWLPAPKGPFNLTMRLYAPKSDALTGKWVPPAITRHEALSPLTAQ